MKEKIKKNWKIILVCGLILTFVCLYFLFVLDIGINSKYFINKDLTTAFLYRKTGNCTAFKNFFLRDIEGWGERCIEEKDREIPPIKNFSIKDISINGNEAFLQVELIRDITEVKLEKGEDYGYVVSYNMQKINKDKFLFIFPKTRWVITNELR